MWFLFYLNRCLESTALNLNLQFNQVFALFKGYRSKCDISLLLADEDQIPAVNINADNGRSDITNKLLFGFFLLSSRWPSNGSKAPQSETCRNAVEEWYYFIIFARSPLGGSYRVQPSVIHRLTGLPNRTHSCSHFDKRSHLPSCRREQLVALYCQDERLPRDLGPEPTTEVQRLVVQRCHKSAHTITHLSTWSHPNMIDF